MVERLENTPNIEKSDYQDLSGVIGKEDRIKNAIIEEAGIINNSELIHLLSEVNRALLNIPFGLSKASGYEIRKKRFLILYFINDNGEKDAYVFDLKGNDNIFIGNDTTVIETVESKLQNEREENLKEIALNTEKFDNILSAMEEVFTENDGIFTSGYLDEDDILKTDKFGKELKGKNIEELYKIARLNWHTLVQLQQKVNIKGTVFEKEIQKLEWTYTQYIMGLGDKYEGGASLFKKTLSEVASLVLDLVDSKNTTDELFDFYINVHKIIHSNTKKSETVRNINKDFIYKLNSAIYSKLLKNNESDEILLRFAKLITGRNKTGPHYTIDGMPYYMDMSTDSKMEDPKFANEIIVDIFQRKGGILDRMTEKNILDLDDKEVKDKNPSLIVTDFISIIDNLKVNGEKWSGKDTLEKLGYGRLSSLNISDYSQLTLEQKIQIGTIYRIGNKISQKIRQKEIEHQRRQMMLTCHDVGGIYWEKSSFDNFELTQAELVGILGELSAEAWKDAQNAVLTSKFERKRNDWNGLDKSELSKYKDENGNPLFSEVELDVIDLYNDINGNSLFDFSDDTVNTLSELAKIGIPTLVGSILITAVVIGSGGTILLAGAVMGASASIISFSVDDRGHDTLTEAMIDVGSDVGLGIVSGVAGGALTQRFYADGVKILGRELLTQAGIKNATVIAIDFVAISAYPEMKRMEMISRMFHDPKNLYEKDENIENQFNEKILRDRLFNAGF